MLTLTRSPKNPIILPSNSDWEKKAAFNGSVVEHDGTYHMVYRAQSVMTYYQGNSMSLSTVGYAKSDDGVTFTDHRQLLKPENDWDLFGCEDPRITYFDGKFYIFYTALSHFPFSAPGIRVGVAITKDFEHFEERHLITPFNAKAMGLFPERINGKIAVILAANTDLPPAKIGIALFDKEEELWNQEVWNNWYGFLDDHALSLLREPKDQVEVGAVPLRVKDGWLLIYSYIRDYHTDHKIFGIEAALLDPDDPKKVLKRTTDALLVPETDYEKYGDVPNIVFPSGALIEDDTLHVYYGGADTNVCVATCKLSELMSSMTPVGQPPEKHKESEIYLDRFEENPIITPINDHPWERKATFNPAVIYEEGKIHIFYRAMSDDNISVFGYASTSDGHHIEERLPDPIYVPREMFERSVHNNGNAGCEDPRITRLEGRYYVLYTAYDGVHPPRVAMSSISVEDFLKKDWNWALPKLISPPDIDDKDACIFPEKINDKYVFLHRLQSGIWIDDMNTDLHFYEGNYLGGKILFQPREKKWDSVRIGIAGPPHKTDKGWLLLYHGITQEHEYLLGAALLKLDNPSEVLSRLDYPIFTPEMKYEKEGQVPNVVFPCGSVIKGDDLLVYYGGADSVVAVASTPLAPLLSALTK